MIDLKRILVPTDFSTHSRNALRYAAALAEKFGAELLLLNVVQDLALFVPDVITAGPVMIPQLDELLASVRAALGRLIAEFDVDGQTLTGLTVKAEVVEGTPFHEIIEYARGHSVDLIVMGTHGRGALTRLLMGSVAEKVVRKAPCPVLTVHDPEHEFVHS